jgi:Undecaprenyl-phosphate galactose phosphotransferase WbaP
MASNTVLLPRSFTASWLPSRGILMTACLALTDSVGLLISVAAGVLLKELVHGPFDTAGYVRLWPFLFVFICVYGAIGLYSGVALSPPEELRRATLCSTLTFLFLAATTVSLRSATSYFTWRLGVTLSLSIVLFPLLRAALRRAVGTSSWWGYPTVVFGAGRAGMNAVKAMIKEPGLGLKPIAVVDDSVDEYGERCGVPIIRSWDLAHQLSRSHGSIYAVVTPPLPDNCTNLETVERNHRRFSHTLLIPDILGFSNLWINPKNLGGILGLEVQPQIFLFHSRLTKRLLDLTLVLLAAPFLLPLAVTIAFLIKLDSDGPVFYWQRRIGRDGKTFEALKFRTMVTNAAEVLEKYLEQDPAANSDWVLYRKIRNDVRKTRIGAFLRSTSLDEIPQLWNVLRGDMSLVGPRPIVSAEIERYGAQFEIYKKVAGGVTGLWQVSGRNDTSYQERVDLDVFYVRNWSVWLDLCILFRTIETVCFRKGAY